MLRAEIKQSFLLFWNLLTFSINAQPEIQILNGLSTKVWASSFSQAKSWLRPGTRLKWLEVWQILSILEAMTSWTLWVHFHQKVRNHLICLIIAIPRGLANYVRLITSELHDYNFFSSVISNYWQVNKLRAYSQSKDFKFQNIFIDFSYVER